jgi:SAM-dependent methyltransferase
MPKPKPSLIPPRPRDLLKLTRLPIHPFDQTYGVDTSGLVPAANLLTGHPNDEHVTAYYGVAPSILRQLIAHWRETIPPHPIHRYTFVDIGAGKGRALLVASQLRFQRVVGVELNPALAAIARQNAAQWTAAHAADSTAPQLSPIEVLEQDALDLTFAPTPTVLFLFHPFEAPVLTQLLDNITTQLTPRRPGAPSMTASPSWMGRKTPSNKPATPARAPALDILYVNAECANLLDAHPAFTRLFLDSIPMTPEDHAADREAIARQKDYGSTGDEECAIYRFTPNH